MAIIGEPLEDYVINQIKTRQKLHGSLERTPIEINILNSNTSWLKLASATSVSKDRLKEIGVDSTLSEEKLAKNFILFGGLSSLDSKNKELNQREGFLPGPSNVNNTSYTYGQFGYSPMPGLISADVKNLNRGSIKKATVKLVAHNVQQFQIIDLLYLRLGYTVLLEWGHSLYPKNSSDPIKKGIMGPTLIEEEFYKNKDFNTILKKISKKREKYNGNYDGFLAKVSNYQWDFKEDGSYDITLTLISLGDVIESLKTNISPDQSTSDFIKNSVTQYSFPATDSDEDNVDSTENNKTTSIIHSMLYIWKWIRELNKISTSTNPNGYIRINNDTTIGNETFFLDKEPKPNTGAGGGGGNLTVSSTSYDFIIPYRILYHVFLSNGYLNTTYMRKSDGAFYPYNASEFNDSQRYKGTVGPFDFSTYDGNKGLPMIDWGFTRDFPRGTRSGYLAFNSYIYFPNAVTIPSTSNIDDELKKAWEIKCWELAKKFTSIGEGGCGIDGFGYFKGSGKGVFTDPSFALLEGAFDIYDSSGNITETKEYDNFEPENPSGRWSGGFDLFYGPEVSSGTITPSPGRKEDYKRVIAMQPDNTPFQFKEYESGYFVVGWLSGGRKNTMGGLPLAGSGRVTLNVWSIKTMEKVNKNDIGWFQPYTFPSNFAQIKSSFIKESLSVGGSSGPTTTVTIDNPLKDAGPKDAFVIDTKQKNYYLRFGYLLDYIRKNVLPRVKTSSTHDNNPSIFKINSETENNIMFSLPEQISFDPRVCIVRNDNFVGVQSFKSLEPFRLTDSGANSNIKADSNFAALSMNIYLNFNFIIESLSEDQYGNVNLYDFISNLCTGINKALGSANNIEPVIDEDTNILQIIETTPIPGTVRNNSSKHNSYKLQMYGYDGTKAVSNFIRKFNLKTAITPQFATMITVGATSGGYTKGVEATAFSKWNTGLKDRYKTKFVPGNKATAEAAEQAEVSGSATEDEAVTNFKNRFETPSLDFNRYGYAKVKEENKNEEFLEHKDNIINGNLTAASEYFKYYMASKKETGEDGGGGMIGFIPFKLNFEMDGMSGIKIYNKLTVDTSFLPAAYRDQLDLVVTGVSHKISNQDWVTSIETTVIPNSNPKKSSRTFTPSNNATNATVTGGGKVGGTGAKTIPADPNKKCGKAAGNHCTDPSIHVDNVYPKTTYWGGGSLTPKINPTKWNPPTVKVKKSTLPTTRKVWTKLNQKSFIQKAKNEINFVLPRASSAEKNEVLVALYAKMTMEQPSYSKGGPGNNYFGIEGVAWKVYPGDVGKIQRMEASEGGTNIVKYYWSFNTVEIGMRIAISIIAERSMHGAVGASEEDKANEFAWRYFRDWNGYGARTTDTYKTHFDDCKLISRWETTYKNARQTIKNYGLLF